MVPPVLEDLKDLLDLLEVQAQLVKEDLLGLLDLLVLQAHKDRKAIQLDRFGELKQIDLLVLQE